MVQEADDSHVVGERPPPVGRGVELVQRYSDPSAGRHSIQIELSRALYMDENLVEKHAGFGELKANLSRLMELVCAQARDKAGNSGRFADAAE